MVRSLQALRLVPIRCSCPTAPAGHCWLEGSQVSQPPEDGRLLRDQQGATARPTPRRCACGCRMVLSGQTCKPALICGASQGHSQTNSPGQPCSHCRPRVVSHLRAHVRLMPSQVVQHDGSFVCSVRPQHARRSGRSSDFRARQSTCSLESLSAVLTVVLTDGAPH